jgi:ribosome-binding protein aMBF1 (putative translation factor)
MICAITQMTPPPAVEEIARLVREERRRQGLDQKTLALVANVAVRSVHRIEHAEETVRFDTLLRVLGALGLKITVHRRGDR